MPETPYDLSAGGKGEVPAADVPRPSVRQVTMPSGFRAWLITGYASARTALADPRFAKDSRRLATLMKRHGAHKDGRFEASLQHHMLNSDPPDHERLRKLVTKAFTMRRVERLRPRIERIAAQLLEAMPPRGEVDLIHGFAVPMPITVIGELLGVPGGDQDRFGTWSTILVSALETRIVRQATTTMDHYLRELIGEKRARPGDDLLSALIDARDTGDRLTEDELVSMTFLLLAAGHETTVNLIGNGMLALLTHPQRFTQLRSDRSLLPAAIEEFLRYDGPVSQATLRFTTEDVDLDGVRIPEGEFVVVDLDAAHHDAGRYPSPGTLDFTRPVAGHLGFGHGIHYCLGAPLARLEAHVAFTALMDRFEHIALAVPVDRLSWRVSALMRGLERLPVRLG